MIAINLDALLIIPATTAVGFLLWFLVMIWKEERRKP
jgi:hypothetical protein